jgi:transposase InsO family protein
MTARGLSERHALNVVGMSASSLRYQPAPDRNAGLREAIVALAHRHRRYGAGMIYLKLRQRGWWSTTSESKALHGGVCKYAGASARRCRWAIVSPGATRAANEVWSMDFVFDRSAEGGSSCLTIVDDATHESVAVVERTISGLALTRILDSLLSRGLPR